MHDIELLVNVVGFVWGFFVLFCVVFFLPIQVSPVLACLGGLIYTMVHFKLIHILNG